jgi:DNA-binding NtrC family response regulator
MVPTILVIDPDPSHRRHFKDVLDHIGMAGDFFDRPEELPVGFDIAAYPAAVIDLDSISRPRLPLESWRQHHRDIRLIGVSAKTFHPDLGDIIDRYLFACIKKPVEPEELACLLKNITSPE